VGVTVRSAEGRDLDALVEALLVDYAAKEERGESIAVERNASSQLDGRPAVELQLEVTTGGATYSLVQMIAVEDGRVFLAQAYAPVENYPALEPLLAPVMASFAFVPHGPEAIRAHEWELARIELASHCGDDVDWARDWEDAAARARLSGRPILIVTDFLQSFSLPSTPRHTTFMDEDVIALVNARFVPLWVSDRKELHLTRWSGEAYGMGPSTFGRAIFVVDAGGYVFAEAQEAGVPEVVFPFLASVLARLDSAWVPGSGGEVWERASALVDGGQLDEAWSLLEEAVGIEAARERARILGLWGRDAEALEELELALAAPARAGDAEQRERARLGTANRLLALGRVDEAGSALEALGEDSATLSEELAARTLMTTAVVDLARGDRPASRARLVELINDFGTTRWAWQAAYFLGSLAFQLDLEFEVGSKPDDVLAEILRPFEPDVVPASQAREAARDALDWLLAAQRPDGSFPAASEFGHRKSFGPNPFADASTALAGRALFSASGVGMERGDEAEAAARKAVACVVASVASRETTPPRVFYMDYMTWSDAAMLDLLADAAEARPSERKVLQAPVAALLDDLAVRQQANGGWSYYKKNDLSAADVPAQSISFTTAGVSLALSHAEAAGFDVPDSLSRPATQALRELRDPTGVFAYFLHGSGVEPHPPIEDPRGDVGRGPACELALFRAGVSDPERLAAAVDAFLNHAPLFQAQLGKALMHAGPQGQGCHYLYFDYVHAALAAAELAAPSGRRRTRILDLVLEGRQADGSFLDTPINGFAYGTAMALRVLVTLRDQEVAKTDENQRIGAKPER
jgi:tetratricopeptide (TPR) repeat protein